MTDGDCAEGVYQTDLECGFPRYRDLHRVGSILSLIFSSFQGRSSGISLAQFLTTIIKTLMTIDRFEGHASMDPG
jgi:hypothetical protein